MYVHFKISNENHEPTLSNITKILAYQLKDMHCKGDICEKFGLKIKHKKKKITIFTLLVLN